MKRYCQHSWFVEFEFLTYSKSLDGIFCLACILFPSGGVHEQPKLLVKQPYRNWKDAREDLKKHSVTTPHQNAMARLKGFIQNYQDPRKRIDFRMNDQEKQTFEKNRKFLISIIKCVEFCGRQGISLRGHRDDGLPDLSRHDNTGNFQALLKFRVDSGDKELQEHLETCKKNQTYISKTGQNQFLEVIKEYMQDKIIGEVMSQPGIVGPIYSYQADEVTDISMKEQLGLILQYLLDGEPVEKLIEYMICQRITGEVIFNLIKEALERLSLDTKNCVAQTVDGAGNMSGGVQGCTARFQEENPNAQYFHCGSHNLNLALCDSCKDSIPIRDMLSSVKESGKFIRKSAKRTTFLAEKVKEVNENLPKESQLPKSKLAVFTEQRWVERHVVLADVKIIYVPLLMCLRDITTANGWDTRTAVIPAAGLVAKLTSPDFIVALQVASQLLGYTKQLSILLQGEQMDIIKTYKNIEIVKAQFNDIRNNVDAEYNPIWEKCEEMSREAGIELTAPRVCGRQEHRTNVRTESAKDHYRVNLFIPFLDHIITALEKRFSQIHQYAVKALLLIPSNLQQMDAETMQEIKQYYGAVMPDPAMFEHEMKLWKKHWELSPQQPPDSLPEALKSCDSKLYPNIYVCLYRLLVIPVTSSSAERSHSALKDLKTKKRANTGEDRLNALMLLYVHKDMPLDYDDIVDRFARKYPRRMLFINPLGPVDANDEEC